METWLSENQLVPRLHLSIVEGFVFDGRHHSKSAVESPMVVPLHPLAGLPFNSDLVVLNPKSPDELGLVEAVQAL